LFNFSASKPRNYLRPLFFPLTPLLDVDVAHSGR